MAKKPASQTKKAAKTGAKKAARTPSRTPPSKSPARAPGRGAAAARVTPRKTATKKPSTPPGRSKSAAKPAPPAKSAAKPAPPAKSAAKPAPPAKSAAKPAAPAKAAKPVANAPAPRPAAPAAPARPAKKPATTLKKSELERFREVLITKRDLLVGDLQSLESQAFRASEQDSSANHMADFGSDNYEQDFNLGLIENDEEAVNLIDEALARIDSREYGICLECGIQIPDPRLDAIPWARFCVNCQAQNEQS